MKRYLSLILALILAFTLTGCGGGDDSDSTQALQSTPDEEGTASADGDAQTPDTSELDYDPNFDPETHADRINYAELDSAFGPLPEVPEGMTLGALMPDLSNEFWSMVALGIEDACADYGITLDVQSALDPDDMAGQLAMAEAMYGNDYDAYILSPLTDDMFTDIAARMRADGKPVINACGQLVRNADVFVGSMNRQTGYLSGVYVAEQLGGIGRVAYCMGAVGLSVNTNRCDGYDDAFADVDIEIVTALAAEWDAERARSLTTDLLTADPDIDAILCVNDNMAMGVIEALRGANRLGDIMVIGIDGTAAGYDSLALGELTATVDSFPRQCGYIAVELAIRRMHDQQINRVVEGPLEVVTQSNYTQFQG